MTVSSRPVTGRPRTCQDAGVRTNAFRRLPPTVHALDTVSLPADLSNEMIYSSLSVHSVDAP